MNNWYFGRHPPKYPGSDYLESLAISWSQRSLISSTPVTHIWPFWSASSWSLTWKSVSLTNCLWEWVDGWLLAIQVPPHWLQRIPGFEGQRRGVIFHLEFHGGQDLNGHFHPRHGLKSSYWPRSYQNQASPTWKVSPTDRKFDSSSGDGLAGNGRTERERLWSLERSRQLETSRKRS